MGGKNGALPVESENGAVNVRLLQENTDVIGKITGWKIIRSIDDDIIRGDKFLGIFGGEEAVVKIHLHIGVDLLDGVTGTIDFFTTNISGAMKNLTLEI